MEIYISLGAVIIALITLILNRIDKAKKESKEENKVLIEYRLNQVEIKLDKILEKLDRYDEEIDIKVDKALQNHIATYHTRTKKGEL